MTPHSYQNPHSTHLASSPATPEEIDQLVHFDQAHIWHPYSPTPARVDPVIIDRTEGAYLVCADGRRLIDGMSSWWAAAHGHSHPRLVAAAQAQIAKMSHVMFGGLSHAPAVSAAKVLLELIAQDFAQARAAGRGRADAGESLAASTRTLLLEKVFFADSGSVAVEVAMKMALQYQRGRGKPERKRFLTWRRGYHGDTFAAMSVCDPDGGMHAMWTGVIADHVFAPAPPRRGSSAAQIADYVAVVLDLISPDIAGLIVEPKVQGAGGMLFHDDALLVELRALCDEHELVFIADEIATGFGRTGTLFATTSAGVMPDIMCVGKALTGGFMSLAATVATSTIARVIDTPAGGGALMHGPTFMANPLACAVAAESMSMIQEGQWRDDVARIEQALSAGLAHLRQHPRVADVRVLGAIGVVELIDAVDMQHATTTTCAHGVWLRPFGRLVYTMPPYCATNDEVARICTAITAIVDGP
ncbi:adenosylmethionine--8-amino-7-oxononanoate transaminase [Corynebacterium felinum]|uniref:Adenosylmethionine-8-amino-7-oxononanoate aminotransferase n=1 Tax=Corynebacterium felinum TaxID=131318 RepID=A0ABU2BB90_9CORY|nr:adenosylmethionine--8-amino-7-oxononanoate transaminase [Corynebacterium felinum]MDF5819725.1 adenosylmethionine--8-amino-7-oxononanoate transaminase [Corynebacterium felinum]MDR7355556.1 adenosylmethionine-8-amino-7-oxononanoate aminotransferase [Corynebacterium felinum]WJY94906.1 Adenosylmethionine-8-amino-7-oxononanoate aminotransferase [Corynebacterium felinum]